MIRKLFRKKTNIIQLGNSFNDYVKKLEYNKGKANRLLYKQLINYATSIISIHVKNNRNKLIGANIPVSKNWEIYFNNKKTEENFLFNSEIEINDDYANYVLKHSVPLDMNFIKLIKNNNLALDFYKYLVYRNNELKKEISIKDVDLIKHFGAEDTNIRKIRMKLKLILNLIKQYWHVKANFEDGYFILKPSEPAVTKKLSPKDTV